MRLKDRGKLEMGTQAKNCEWREKEGEKSRKTETCKEPGKRGWGGEKEGPVNPSAWFCSP